jgi:hypothetical protein
MSDKSDLIAAKKEEIRNELATWAEAHLQPGEQLVFELLLVSYPSVIESHCTKFPELLAMNVKEYFTEKRFSDAGLTRGYRRAYYCLLNAHLYEDRLGGKPANTVRDIASLSKAELMELPNLGDVSLRVIEAVFKHDGIKLSE